MLIFYSLFSFLIPILIIGAIVYLIVRPNHRKAITPYNSLMGYFYFVTAASIITTAVGVIYFIRIAINEINNTSIDSGDEIALASTLVIIGMIIFALHAYGRRVTQREGETVTSIRRVYLFIMLIGCSITGLITIPLSIYRTIHYYIEDSPYSPYSPYSHYSSSFPSTEVGIALVFVVLWAYYMSRVLKEVRQNGNGIVEA